MEENIEKKSNKGLIITIVVLVAILLLLGGYIVYDKVINKNNVNETTNGTQETIQSNENQNNGTVSESSENQNNENIAQSSEEKTNGNNTEYKESDFIRKTKLVLVKEPECTGAATSLEAEINENKNIAISQNLGAEEIIVGNAKYIYSIGLFACDNITLYYITEDYGLYKVERPSAGDPNQKGKKVTSSQIIEFLGEDHRDDGNYLKVLTKDKKVEYIKYFTSPDYNN